MKMKTVLQWFTALSLTTAACMGFGVIAASAATLDKDNIKVNYETQKLIVTLGESGSDSSESGGGSSSGGGNNEEAGTQSQAEGDDSSQPTDNQILFGISTFKKNKNQVTTSAWEVYDATGDEVIIDLSSLNTQKDNYVQVKGDVSSDPITLYIPATDKTAKLKFNAYAGVPEITKGTDATKGATTKWQYRTQYGDWTEYTFPTDSAKGVDLSIYQERGATLYFRIATIASAQPSETKSDLKDAKNQALSNAYTMPSLPGKEIKVAVGKKAAAPKATADYLKQTVTIPKGALWRVNSAEKLGTFTTTATEGKYVLDKTTDAEAYKTIFAGGSVEVKTAGNQNKKKAESKVFQLSFKAKEETVVTNNESNKDVTKSIITEAEGKTVTAELDGPIGSKKTYNLKIKNATDNKYEVVLGGTTAPVVGASGVKVIGIAKGGTATLRNVKADNAVWIHRAGDKKTTMWATDFVSMGKIVISDSGSDTPSPTEPTEKELLTSLSNQLFEESVTLASSVKAGTGANVVKNGETVSWNASADYTLTEGSKKIEGVTITVTVPGDDANLEIDYSDTEDGPILLLQKGASWTDSTTVTVTLTKGETVVTKNIIVQIAE